VFLRIVAPLLTLLLRIVALFVASRDFTNTQFSLIALVILFIRPSFIEDKAVSELRGSTQNPSLRSRDFVSGSGSNGNQLSSSSNLKNKQNFVADAVKVVGPAVVRIDTEKTVDLEKEYGVDPFEAFERYGLGGKGRPSERVRSNVRRGNPTAFSNCTLLR